MYRGTGRRLVKSPKPELGAKALGAADEGAAAQIEAEEAVGGAGDADAPAFAEGAAGFWCGMAAGDCA